jgi:hypothetical protein
MSESRFTETLIASLAPFVAGCDIATRKSVLYAVSFDEHGKLQLGVDNAGEPIRGGGTGFEQDILVFERVQSGDTTVVPRVIVEVKFGSVTTHDAIIYSEKARRIRTIYPFVRYGLILGQMDSIPGRVLRLGQEFDFIVVVSYPTSQSEIKKVGNLFEEELQASRNLAAVLSGQKRIKALCRSLKPVFT